MRIDLKRVLSGEDHPADPWPGYARLREEPVRRVRLREGLFCWVVSGYAEARAALSDPRLSRDPRFARAEWREADRGRALEDGANLGVHLLTREPPDHTRMRRLVTADFSTHQAAAVRGRLRELADSLIDGFAPRGTAELIADFAYPLAISMIADVLGVPKEDHSIFRQWTSNAVRHAQAPGPAEYLRRLIEAKRERPDDGLISRLANAAEQDRLTQTELESMVFLLLVAGHEGSVALIGNGVLALLTNPGQAALIRSRPELTGSAVEEILRYDGPMELAAWRFATEDVDLDGVAILAGDPVVVALAAAHRDPSRYPQPDRLDLARRPQHHLGFGHGVHYCPGASLAREEAAVALETIFRQLPDLTLAIPAADLQRQPSTLVRGLHALPVRFTPVVGG